MAYNDPIAQFLMSNAQRKNPNGFFGMQIAPYMTPQDQRAVRYNELLAGLQDKGDFITAGFLSGGNFLGQMANKLMGGGGQGQQQADPQQAMMQAYVEAIQSGKNEMDARKEAAVVGMRMGMPQAAELYAEADKAAREEADRMADNKRADLQYADQWEDLPERTPNGQLLQRNKMTGEMRAVGSGPAVGSINVGTGGEGSKKFIEYFYGTIAPKAAEEAASAKRTITAANAMLSLNNDTKFSGPIAGALLGPAKALASVFGVAEDAVSNYEQLHAAGFDRATTVAQYLKPMSNTDMDLVLSTGPGLRNTQKANRAMGLVLRATAQAQVDYNEAVKEFYTRANYDPTGEVEGMKLNDYLANKLADKEYFTKEEREFLKMSKPAAKDGRTVVRTGTVQSGPNKGKKAIKYSDGTVEYE